MKYYPDPIILLGVNVAGVACRGLWCAWCLLNGVRIESVVHFAAKDLSMFSL